MNKHYLREKELRERREPRKSKGKQILSSKADPGTSELVMTFNQKETSLGLLDGLNTSPSKGKKEFFSPESKFPQQLLSSPELWTRIKLMFFSDF